MRFIDREKFRYELGKMDCIDKFGYVILPITKLNIALERSAVGAVQSALEKQEGRSPFPDNDTSILACPFCGSGEYLHNADENRNTYCGQCGQRIDWLKEEAKE